MRACKLGKRIFNFRTDNPPTGRGHTTDALAGQPLVRTQRARKPPRRIGAGEVATDETGRTR
jgi:hypothetical protein